MQDLNGSVGVPLLRIERGARVVRHHGVAALVRVLHAAPWVVLGCGLVVPDVTTVAEEVSALDGSLDGIGVADGTTSRVDEPGTLLHALDRVGIDEVLGALVEGAVDSNDVTLREEVLEVRHAACVDLLGCIGRQVLVVKVEELLAVEGHETLQNSVTNSASANGTDNLALEIVSITGNGRDLPAAIAAEHDLLVAHVVIADENEDGHDDVLGNRDDVGARDLSNSDLALVGRVEVNVVRTNTGSDAELEVLGGCNHLAREVTGVEGSGNDNICVDNFLCHLAVWALLVIGDLIIKVRDISAGESVVANGKNKNWPANSSLLTTNS